jgi:Flp pilus assembly pilin Flp
MGVEMDDALNRIEFLLIVAAVAVGAVAGFSSLIPG